MESAVANLVIPGEPAVACVAGKFGERWQELCDAYGADTVVVEAEWGDKVDPASLDAALRGLERPARAVFATQSETSTGVVHDVRALNEAARAHGAVLAWTPSRASAPSTCRRTSGESTWSSRGRRSR